MKINHFTAFNQLNISNANNFLARLNVGQTIQTQVINTDSKGITLRLPDGSIITATSTIPIDRNIGDFLDLTIKIKTESQIFMEISQEYLVSESKTEDIRNKLASFRIPANDKNIDIVREMIKNNITLSKENFKLVSGLLNRFRQASPDRILFLLSNDIPINQKNITMFDEFLQHKHLLGEKLARLIKQIHSLTNLHTATSYIKDERPFANNNLTDKTIINIENSHANGNILKNTELQFTQTATQTFTSETSVSKDISQKIENTNILIQESIKKMNNELNTLNILIKNKNAATKNEILNTINDKLASDLKDIIKMLFKPIDGSNADMLPNEISASKVIKEILYALEVIKTKFNNLENKVKLEVINVINDIEQSFDFLKQLNKVISFIQIPININSHHTTLELYVLKDEHNKNKIDPFNTTIFLSFDTVNLGLVEAFITIINKNIDCQFQMKNREMLNFIKNNITPLYSLLETYGYKLINVTYKEIAQKANILDIKQIKERVNKRYAFDIRV
ncbi:MAG: hypothetical protein PWP27_418 [Clostridiales bacterium]|jgi:hypothetical protein|nr:hypothetical protein [Clostridiales bacterium]